MKLRDILRPGVSTTVPSEPLSIAYAEMRRSGHRHLPVMKDGLLVGLLSERDVFAARSRVASSDYWSKLEVHDAMTAPAKFAHPDDALSEVAARMAAAKIGAFPVIEHGKLVGIASSTDVLAALVTEAMEPPPPQRLTAADVMTPYPLCVRADTLLAEAIEKLIAHRVRHLPVVDATGAVVGMLSERDVRTAVGDLQRYADFRAGAVAQFFVADVMTKTVSTVPFDRSVADIVTLFADEHVGAVPVLDRFGALIGIVSYVDVLRALVATSADRSGVTGPQELRAPDLGTQMLRGSFAAP